MRLQEKQVSVVSYYSLCVSEVCFFFLFPGGCREERRQDAGNDEDPECGTPAKPDIVCHCTDEYLGEEGVADKVTEESDKSRGCTGSVFRHEVNGLNTNERYGSVDEEAYSYQC